MAKRDIRRLVLGTLTGLALLAFVPGEAAASPQFARQHSLDCGACHELAPHLNNSGRAFRALGYRLPDALDARDTARKTVPLAVWITARYEDRGTAEEAYLPKLELVSGGSLGQNWSYFAEWRIVSRSLSSDGSLGERNGRFEDLFVSWQPSDRHEIRVGQFRLLDQVDVSLRLSPSDPLLFKNSLRTGTHSDPRRQGLASFSPSSRSPTLRYTFRSRTGPSAADGLFHSISVPFAGELSIPLGGSSDDAASFELSGPKGVFLETYHRRGDRSLGLHAFLEDDAWLVTALATHRWRSLLLTAGAGLDSEPNREDRERLSLAGEYLLRASGSTRGAVGLRLEEVSNDGRSAVAVPYIAVALPNRRHTFLLQVEFQDLEDDDRIVAELSLVL